MRLALLLLVSCAATRDAGLCRQAKWELGACITSNVEGAALQKRQCVRESVQRCRHWEVDSACCAADQGEENMSP